MSFFCGHFEAESEGCRKLKCECIPGRPGCVLRGKVTFLEPPEKRIAQRRAPAPARTARTRPKA